MAQHDSFTGRLDVCPSLVAKIVAIYLQIPHLNLYVPGLALPLVLVLGLELPL